MSTIMETPRTRAFHPEQAGLLGTSLERPGWDLETERRIDDGRTLATALGWFSIGLGLAEVLAPERLARWLGMEGQTELIRAYGVREIATGVGILKQRRPADFVWGRVAGDFLDLATLAPALSGRNPNRDNAAKAMAAVVAVTALDVIAGRQLSREH